MHDNQDSDDERAVREVLQGTVDAWTANDADAFAARYTKDATVMLAAGEQLRGRDEVRAFMAAGFGGRLRGSRGMDEPQSVRKLGADAAGQRLILMRICEYVLTRRLGTRAKWARDMAGT
jgi:uncharacterized protein (TIGR02246 family)